MNNLHLAVLFFLQIAVILLACRVVGLIARRFGQPQVFAEMVTGVLLGPSLFGWLAPDIQSALFPWDPTQKTRDTQSYLFPASQLGLALYMFIVGMEFRVDIVRRHFRSSMAVSAAGIVTPFVLGGLLGWAMKSWTSLFPEETSLARRCRSRLFRCSPGSSTSSGSRERAWARSRSVLARSTTPPHGACSRWCWRASTRTGRTRS